MSAILFYFANLRWMADLEADDNMKLIFFPILAVDAINKIRLGNTSVSVIEGQAAFTSISDKRIKNNIKDGDLGLDFITKLRPVKYNMVNPADYPKELLEKRFKGETPDKRPEDNSRVYDGLIAQEVEKTLEKMNKTWSGHNIGGGEGKQQSLAYSSLTMPLIKAVQELNEENIQLKAAIAELSEENIQLKAAIAAIKVHVGL